MTQSADWEIVRHHVSICGQVLDVNGNPMADIQLSALPDATPSQARAGGVRREAGKVRKDDAVSQVLGQIRKTESRHDGMFFFLDCPDGKYTISARDLRSRMQAQKSISVDTAMKKHMKDRGTEEGYQIELVLKK